MADASLRSATPRELESTLTRLEVIWDDIGMPDEQREIRRGHFFGHIANLCDKVVDGERALKNQLTNSIEQNTRDVLKLCEELCMKPEEDVEGLTLLELDALMQERVEKLQQIMNERLETLRHLQEKDEGLCEVLNETPYYIPSGFVPSTDDLKAVEEHVRSMEKEKVEREKTFRSLKAGLLKFLEQLEQSPEDTISQEVICCDNEDIPLSKVDLQYLKTVHSDLEFRVQENKAKSEELREKIANIWSMLEVPREEQQAFLATAPKHTPSNIAKLNEELERLLLLRHQNLSLLVEKLQKELSLWWDKCYVDIKERDSFLTMFSDEANEDKLSAYEREIKKWKKYYMENSELLGMVATFLTLFGNMLELEERAKDPSRLFNTRGGALLQEEKAKKKVKAQQAKVADNKRGTNLVASHIRTPGPLASTKKRGHEGDDPASSKRSKHLTPSVGGVIFKSPSKSAVQTPLTTPQGKPLMEYNGQRVLNLVTSTTTDASLHSTLSYDKFEAGIGERCQDEIIHSSVLESATPSPSYFPAFDQLRERRLRDTLHLASPVKGQHRGKIPPFVCRTSAFGSSLRRVASQPCLSIKLRGTGLRPTNKQIPKFFGNKEHPVMFLM
ncbi:regulator of cytokinesis 1-like 1 [Homarus americanus]|uniref:Regulator of cytokinesis 1-like 1 n=1 Tax=Homarus americanus TaxID=6706 RepID=A0A8J5JF40_HOMAM|nr:regulator of cytokinesis 1-like 1 [Homarus americanus]